MREDAAPTDLREIAEEKIIPAKPPTPVTVTAPAPEEPCPPAASPEEPPSWTQEQEQTQPPPSLAPESRPPAAPGPNQEALDWPGFAAFCGESSGPALQSLLKNAVPLEYDNKRLLLGCKSPGIFTEQRRTELTALIAQFLGRQIRLEIQQSDLGEEESLSAKERSEREAVDQARRDRARGAQKIQQITGLFEGSEIEGIIFDEEE